MNDFKYPLIIAHRGASKEAFENSFEAFKLAIKQKADLIELDTHLTKDGYFIVYHDKNIIFSEKKHKISETKLKTIQEITLPNGEPIPLLEDVLKQFLPSIKFNIEIKCQITRKKFEQLLMEVGGDNTRILVSTFIFKVIEELKNSDYGYDLAFLYLSPSLRNRKISNLDYVSAMNPFHELLKVEHVQLYHKNSKKVYPWTIDRKIDIEKFLDMHVDGIITNYPKKTRDIIESMFKTDSSS